MKLKLDTQNKEVQQIITNLVGDICLYAQENGLQDVRSVREVQECFRYYPDDPPNMKNKFAGTLKHRFFVGKMFMETLKEIYKQIGTTPSGVEVFHAVAEALSEIDDENIKIFSVISKKIFEIAQSGDETEMDELLSKMEEFNNAMRKSFGND